MTNNYIPGVSRSTAVHIIRMRELREKLRLSPSHIYDLISRGLFPAPFRLVPGGRAKGWDESTVDAYLAQRKEEA
jgi:prophage regulatory protein